MRYPYMALKGSDIFLGIQKAMYMCRAVYMLRKDLRRLYALIYG